jgi:hypothetical protein
VSLTKRRTPRAKPPGNAPIISRFASSVGADRNALLAYLEETGHRALCPIAAFDARFYLSHLPPEFTRGINPLAHYLELGHTAMLAPHPVFDLAFLQPPEPPAIPALLEILEATAPPYKTPNILFEPAVYAGNLPNGALAGLAPFEHFLRHWRDYRVPFSRYFDIEFYALKNPHVAKGGLNPLLHYFSLAVDQRADPNPMIHAKFYAKSNPKVTGDPFVHYIRFGITAGFMPNPYAEQELRTKLTDQTREFHVQLLNTYVGADV